jgi:hypothetical protein
MNEFAHLAKFSEATGFGLERDVLPQASGLLPQVRSFMNEVVVCSDGGSVILKVRTADLLRV